MLTISIVLSSVSSIAQTTNILDKQLTLKIKEGNTYEILEAISKQINYYFIYDSKIIQNIDYENFSYKNIRLRNILDSLLQDPELNYQIIKKHILIQKKDAYKSNNSKGQNTDTSRFITITGLIIDSETKKALPYANISLLNKSIGTISNFEGEFLFKLDAKYRKDTICISYMGYKNVYLAVNKISKIKNRIELQAQIIPVQEIIIRSTNPKKLIIESKDRIKKNYSNNAVNITAFYREGITKNNKIVVFSEAILDIYKASYSKNYTQDYIKVVKSRKWIDYQSIDTLMLKLKAGLNSCLILDLVKNSIDFMESDNFSNYQYFFSDLVIYNEKPAYLVEFKPELYSYSSLYEGVIYIDMDNLAIIGVDFKVAKNKIKDFQNLIILKKPRRTRIKIKSAHYHVSYRKVNHKFYLSRVNANINLKIKKRKQFFSNNYNIFMNLAVNDIDSLNTKKIPRKERINTQVVLADNITYFDANFWESYNIITPSESIKKAIEQVKLNFLLKSN